MELSWLMKWGWARLFKSLPSCGHSYAKVLRWVIAQHASCLDFSEHTVIVLSYWVASHTYASSLACCTQLLSITCFHVYARQLEDDL